MVLHRTVSVLLLTGHPGTSPVQILDGNWRKLVSPTHVSHYRAEMELNQA